ncbi:MAG: carboxylesterase family protein [Candidatus Hodarchaeales archaeon]|jgi:predicted esterase
MQLIKENEWTKLTILEKGKKYPKVDTLLSFNTEHFLIKSYIHKTDLKDGDRSWRYGDGIILNFVFPKTSDFKESDKFLAFGLSIEKSKPITVLISKHGKFSLRTIKEIPLSVEVDKIQNITNFEVKIPWKYFSPFHFLIDRKLGINIRRNYQNEDGTTDHAEFVDDPNFESESIFNKKFIPFSLNQSKTSRFQFGIDIPKQLIHDFEFDLNLSIYSPDSKTQLIKECVRNDENHILHDREFTVQLKKGLNKINKIISLPKKIGLYTIGYFTQSAKIQRLVYLLPQQVLKNLDKELSNLESEANTSLQLGSLIGIRYKLNQLSIKVKSFTRWINIENIVNDMKEINLLIDRYKTDGKIFSINGFIGTALKSSQDDTIQPYSFYFPSNFDSEKKYKLIVTLHGSGVDEVNLVNWIGRDFSGIDFIIAGPRGRGLSDAFYDLSEHDVLDMISEIEKMFTITETLIMGFSLGGFVTWKFVLKYPDYFSGAIIISGTPKISHLGDDPKFNLFNLIGTGNKSPMLVIHGTHDRAVPIKNTKKFVYELISKNYNVDYIEIEGGGHGDFDIVQYFKDWIKKTF